MENFNELCGIKINIGVKINRKDGERERNGKKE